MLDPHLISCLLRTTSLVAAYYVKFKGLSCLVLIFVNWSLLISHLHNYFDIHVCLFLRHLSAAAASHPTSDFYHFQSSRSPVGLLLIEAKLCCVYLILKPHFQSSRSPVRLLLPRQSRGAYLNNYFDFHVCLSIRPSVHPSVCLSKN